MGAPISRSSQPGLANIPSAFLFISQTTLFTTSEIRFLKKGHLKDPQVFPGGKERAWPRGAVHHKASVEHRYYPGRLERPL